MENTQKKQRNNLVDIIRGIAMLMVVLGHTMTGSSAGSQNSFLYNFIWALQMPLFMIISGYVVKYSKTISSLPKLLNFAKRRTISYIFPWIVWTFLIRGLAFNATNFLNLKFVLFNMDNGYWFLFSIWTISMFFGLSQYIANKVYKKEQSLLNTFITLFLFCVGATILLLVGLKFGMSFLCIKLTLYYMPFYMLGYFWGELQEKVFALKYGNCVVNSIIFIAGIIFISIISRVNLYEISDGLYGIVLRAMASVTGCIALCGLLTPLNDIQIVSRFFEHVGIHSLEIYLIHYLFLSILTPSVLYEFSALSGFINVAINFLLVITLSIVSTYILNKNKLCKFILFGKR